VRARKGLQSAEHYSSPPPQPLRQDGKLQFRELTQQGVDRNLAFEACQRRTNAAVHSLAKREMAIFRPCDVQRIRLVELVFIPVGGCENRKHQGSARSMFDDLRDKT
jgi:hypothetical protein